MDSMRPKLDFDDGGRRLRSQRRDGSFADADWAKGHEEYHRACPWAGKLAVKPSDSGYARAP